MTHALVRQLTVGILAIGTLSCSAALDTSHRPVPIRTYPPPSDDREVLAGAELDLDKANNAFEIVQHLRPEFLLPSMEPEDGAKGRVPIVFVDGSYQGGSNTLLFVPAKIVLEIRYLRASVAARWVRPYRPMGPVIAVRTTR